MLKLTAVPTPPADRNIEVTVTLTFKESELRGWDHKFVLAATLGEKFSHAIEYGVDGDRAYAALDNLT